MKIYDFVLAPNPRRLRIFLAEKGLNVPNEQINIFEGKNRTPEFLAKNPAGGLPVRNSTTARISPSRSRSAATSRASIPSRI
jgi:hypothetical protein